MPRIRPPDAPIGWPRATAPPLTFTLSGSASSIFAEFNTTDENASFSSTRSTSPIFLPAFASARSPAFAGVRARYANSSATYACATIVSQGYVADEFAYLARTPAKAGAIALEKAGKAIDDVERVELNEAFSSVVLNSAKMLDVDPERVNVNGGAVALGHPIGASGGRIVGTMINELRRNGGGLGLAAICSGGGQGDALLIEV